MINEILKMIRRYIGNRQPVQIKYTNVLHKLLFQIFFRKETDIRRLFNGEDIALLLYPLLFNKVL